MSRSNTTTTTNAYSSMTRTTDVESSYPHPAIVHFDDNLLLQSNNVTETTSLVSKTRQEADTEEGVAGAGQATILSESINIAKNLLGTGVFSMPGGVAMYSNDPIAVYNATIWVILLGGAFGYFCILIAKVCHLTSSTTFRECWRKTMGHRGGLAVSFTQAFLPALGCLSYSAILTQTCRSLLQSVNINVSYVAALLFITVFAVLPLCLLKNLNVLAPYSVVGTAGSLYTVIAMGIRYYDGSYQPGGKFYSDLPVDQRPDYGHDYHPWSTLVLPYVCMVYESWVMHYNTPRFYMELQNASIFRFTLAVSYSFVFSALVFIAITCFGFLTFGSNTSSYILNNYSPHDSVMNASRVTIAISVLTTYAMAFISFRDGVMDCLDRPSAQQSSQTLDRVTVLLLSIMTVIAMFVTDLGLINAVAGGTGATAICCVIPVVMYRQVIVNQVGKETPEVWLAMFLMAIGVVLGVVGVWEAVLAQYK
jgi:amino acid permease